MFCRHKQAESLSRTIRQPVSYGQQAKTPERAQMTNPGKTNPYDFNSAHIFKETSLSMFKSLYYLAGSFVIMGLMTSPLCAMPTKIEKKDSYKVEQVKKKKGKKAQKGSKKINMEILKDGYR